MESLTLAGRTLSDKLERENIPRNMKNIYIIMQTSLMFTATINTHGDAHLAGSAPGARTVLQSLFLAMLDLKMFRLHKWYFKNLVIMT